MSLLQHLPVLLVVIPLVSAPLAVLLRHGNAAFAVVTAAAWFAFAASVALWLQVSDTGVISYHIGSWAPPWGIEYRVDALSSFVLVLVSGMASIVLPWSRTGVARDVPQEVHYLYYAMLGLCLTGLLGIAITGDAFNVFVFLEVSSLSTYVLIALGRDRRALAASYRYLIMGSIGATFIVIGIGFLYLTTGTLNLADMASRLRGVPQTRPVLVAFAFLTVGVSLKLALFPLHQWLPNAYTFAPSAVTAFLAATATKVAVYVLMRFYFSVFGGSLVFDQLPLPQILLVLSLLALFVANFTAIFQTHIKRLFAYSSVGQMGYITLGLSLGSMNGLTASIAHLFNHGLAKGAIFLLLGGMALGMAPKNGPLPSLTLNNLDGVGRRMPWTSLGLVIAGLSLIGVPGTAGFISKWYLVVAAMEQGKFWLVAVILLSSLLALAYVWRFVEIAYFRDAPVDSASKEVSLLALLPAWLLVLGSVWFGLDTSFTVGAATDAAQLLLKRGAQ